MLEKYLKDNYGISATEKVQSLTNNKVYTISQVASLIDIRGTEKSVIAIIEENGLAEKGAVLAYLTGMMTRFSMDNVI